MYGMNGWNWGMGFGWIFGIGILVFIIWFVVYLANQNNRKHSQSEEKSALNILNQRYAKGEISKEEYEEIKRDISY